MPRNDSVILQAINLLWLFATLYPECAAALCRIPVTTFQKKQHFTVTSLEACCTKTETPHCHWIFAPQRWLWHFFLPFFLELWNRVEWTVCDLFQSIAFTFLTQKNTNLCSFPEFSKPSKLFQIRIHSEKAAFSQNDGFFRILHLERGILGCTEGTHGLFHKRGDILGKVSIDSVRDELELIFSECTKHVLCVRLGKHSNRTSHPEYIGKAALWMIDSEIIYTHFLAISDNIIRKHSFPSNFLSFETFTAQKCFHLDNETSKKSPSYSFSFLLHSWEQLLP